jgi:hypothetical protein
VEITAVEVAGPGFINLTIDPGVWREALRAAILAGPDFGRSGIGKAEPVNVEYVSANPTGPAADWLRQAVSLTAVSCPATSLCVAFNYRSAVLTGTPPRRS